MGRHEPKPNPCVLNRSHPMAQRLIACWPFDRDGSQLAVGGGTRDHFSRDILRRINSNDNTETPTYHTDFENTLTTGTSGWRTCEVGDTYLRDEPGGSLSMRLQVPGQLIYTDGVGVGNSNALTVSLWMLVPTDSTVGTEIYFHLGVPAADSSFFQTSSVFRLVWGSALNISTSTNFVDGLAHHWVMTWMTGEYALWLDGELVGRNSEVFNWDFAQTGGAEFMPTLFSSGDGSFSQRNQIIECRAYDIVLTPSHVEQLYRDPWAIYKQ